MDPNDPNNQSAANNTPAQDSTDSTPLSLDALYGPSTPGTETPPAGETAPPPDNFGQPTPPADMPPPPVETPPMESGAATVDPTGMAPGEPMPTMPMDQTPPMEPMTNEAPAPSTNEVLQPGTDATNFYQDLDPQTQYAVETTIPDQAQPDQSFAIAQEEEPPPYANATEGQASQPPGMPPATPESTPTGALPPVPSRSKLPIIIIGIAVILLLALGGTFFLLKGLKRTPAATPTPAASVDNTDPCAIDPTADGCASPSDSSFATATPSSLFTPAPTSATNSGTPKSSLSPQQCQLLYGGPCPQ